MVSAKSATLNHKFTQGLLCICSGMGCNSSKNIFVRTQNCNTTVSLSELDGKQN